MENKDIIQLCRSASDNGISWDYFEDDEIGSPDLRDTAPGTIVLTLKESIQDTRVLHKSIALFVAYAARHSLACWFVYCDDDKPYKLVQYVIGQVLSSDEPSLWSIKEGDLTICRPMENGRPIIDCRAEDTLFASKACFSCGKVCRKRFSQRRGLGVVRVHFSLQCLVCRVCLYIHRLVVRRCLACRFGSQILATRDDCAWDGGNLDIEEAKRGHSWEAKRGEKGGRKGGAPGFRGDSGKVGCFPVRSSFRLFPTDFPLASVRYRDE